MPELVLPTAEVHAEFAATGSRCHADERAIPRSLPPGGLLCDDHSVRGLERLMVLAVGGLVASTVGCGATPRPLEPTRVTAADHPTASSWCGIHVGYIPNGLKLLNVEGGPERNSVGIRFTASDQAMPDRRWAYVGAVWGPVPSLRELQAVYPGARRTSVRGHSAILARIAPDSTLLQWNDADRVSVSVEGRGGLQTAEVRHIAQSLDVPASPPADLPGPPEASPEGCSARG